MRPVVVLYNQREGGSPVSAAAGATEGPGGLPPKIK